MVASNSTPSSGFFARKIYNPLGFTKAYNFWLWVIFGGAMTGFVLARFSYLNFTQNFCPSHGPSPSGNSAAPGECYYYLTLTRYKIGILLHLAGVLPASLLAVLQFTPFIRRRWMILHRLGGYAALLLYMVGLIGALMITRHAFGGGLDVQVSVGLLGIGVLGCFIVSYINIKRLQIEQHRAWMLRGWFYAGTIITSRLITFIAAQIINGRGYYAVWTCAKIAATISDPANIVAAYPSCKSFVDGTNPEAVSLVEATFGVGDTANTGAALNVVFGMALWLSMAMHAFGVEVYLHLTPREAQRLRQVSYQRQLEAGMRNPGSAGLTADRLGDAERWVPQEKKVERMSSPASMVEEPVPVVVVAK
jgi:NADH:ubiquinone oxidoreductase subunit 6 (subunit J)